MSPDLFNMYSEMILRAIQDFNGVKVGGQKFNILRYADDTVLIAQSENKLHSILDTVIKENEKKGLDLNVKKTESRVTTKKTILPSRNIICKGELIKQVQNFRYLGFSITSDGKRVCEIKKRIAMAKDTFNKMKHIMRNRNICTTTKVRVMKAYVWSVLYGCEC